MTDQARADAERLREDDYAVIAEAVNEFLGFDTTTREQQDRIVKWAAAPSSPAEPTQDARLLDTLLLDCVQITDDRALVCRHCEAGIEASKNQPIPHESGCVVGQIIALRRALHEKESHEKPQPPRNGLDCGRTMATADSSQHDAGAIHVYSHDAPTYLCEDCRDQWQASHSSYLLASSAPAEPTDDECVLANIMDEDTPRCVTHDSTPDWVECTGWRCETSGKIIRKRASAEARPETRSAPAPSSPAPTAKKE